MKTLPPGIIICFPCAEMQLGKPGDPCRICGQPIVKAERRRNKYGAVSTTVDGVRFDSQREARRWRELQLLEKEGVIRDLRRQVVYLLCCPGGKVVARYRADAQYVDLDGELIVEDVKGFAKNAVYRIKKRWMLAQYGIAIREV